MNYLVCTIIIVMVMSFFSGMEIGLLSLRNTRVKHAVKQNICRAKILDFFISNPGLMLATTLIGTNICVVSSANSAILAANSFGYTGPGAMLFVACAMTLLLVFAEITAKDWFRQSPFERCMFFAYPLYVAYIALFVPMRLISAVNAVAIRLFSGKPKGWDSTRGLVREDFRTLLRESESAGSVDPEAAQILDRALGFHSLTVADIACPAGDVVTVVPGLTLEEAASVCRRTGKSRLPVESGGGNGWEGVFSIYDAIFDTPEDEWDSRYVGDFIRPLESVDAGDSLNDVLAKARISESNLLAVYDLGDTRLPVGIVTVSDIDKILFGRDS
ncbi:MAG: DUF21 domain-containing protein [Victivallales bacterium]|nr:DUF21 domain-containing protein [Victivallales bacterium]